MNLLTTPESSKTELFFFYSVSETPSPPACMKDGCCWDKVTSIKDARGCPGMYIVIVSSLHSSLCIFQCVHFVIDDSAKRGG